MSQDFLPERPTQEEQQRGYRTCLIVFVNSAFLFVAGLICSESTLAQSLSVRTSTGAVSQGQTLYISAVPSMPSLTVSVAGATSCDTASYQLEVAYTGQDGRETALTWVATSVSATASQNVSWNGGIRGGTAQISWALDGVQKGTMSFFILGTNPPPSGVDSYFTNSAAPWFIRYMASEESRANQTNWTYYQQFNYLSPKGYPIWGTPHGYGIMQVDPPAQDADLWVWSTNLVDGLSVLKGKKNAAYSHWQTQIANALAQGGTTVPSLATTYCGTFSYPQGSNRSYADADWIHAYNSYYYTEWISPQGGNPGRWAMDGYNGSGYVQSVCASKAL